MYKEQPEEPLLLRLPSAPPPIPGELYLYHYALRVSENTDKIKKLYLFPFFKMSYGVHT